MSENKYVELVDQMVEKATALQEMQKELHELGKAKDQEATTVEVLDVTEEVREGVDVVLSIDFSEEDAQVIHLNDRDGGSVALSIEDFNNINQFLGRYNEVIFRFHNHLEATASLEAMKAEAVEAE